MKAYRIVTYVLDFESIRQDEIVSLITNNRYLNIHVGEVKKADIGEWDDDHELNQIGADWEKWFRDAK